MGSQWQALHCLYWRHQQTSKYASCRSCLNRCFRTPNVTEVEAHCALTTRRFTSSSEILSKQSNAAKGKKERVRQCLMTPLMCHQEAGNQEIPRDWKEHRHQNEEFIYFQNKLIISYVACWFCRCWQLLLIWQVRRESVVCHCWSAGSGWRREVCCSLHTSRRHPHWSFHPDVVFIRAFFSLK